MDLRIGDAPSDDDVGRSLAVEDVVVQQQATGNNMMGVVGPGTTVFADGRALVATVDPTGGRVSFRMVRLTEASVDAIRSCVVSPAFEAAAAGAPLADDLVPLRFCPVADAGTTRLVTGAASGAVRSVTFDSGTMAACPSSGTGGSSRSVGDLLDALGRLEQAVYPQDGSGRTGGGTSKPTSLVPPEVP